MAKKKKKQKTLRGAKSAPKKWRKTKGVQEIFFRNQGKPSDFKFRNE